MADDLAGLRQRLAGVLPGRIEAALAGYYEFTATDPPPDAKGFGGWHAAAKAALAHVEVLVKLARWAEGQPESDPADGLGQLLGQARAALEALDDEAEEPLE